MFFFGGGCGIQGSSCVGDLMNRFGVWAIAVAIIFAGSPLQAKSGSEAASFEAEPRMLKPSVVIDADRRVVVIKSRLLNWMNAELQEFLNSGLPLKLSFKVALFEERSFWFDGQLCSVTVKKQVSYDPVKQSYTVSELQGDKEVTRTFMDEKDARRDLLNLKTEIPIPLLMEKYPLRTYYAGVLCDVSASEVDFPFGKLLWFLRTGYTTSWFYSERISTRSLQSGRSGRQEGLGASPAAGLGLE